MKTLTETLTTLTPEQRREIVEQVALYWRMDPTLVTEGMQVAVGMRPLTQQEVH